QAGRTYAPIHFPLNHTAPIETYTLSLHDALPISGEVPKVFIVKKDESLTAEEVIAFTKDKLTAYKRPRHVEFRTELPKTNVGKRSEEHTSELQSREKLVCRLLLEKKKKKTTTHTP